MLAASSTPILEVVSVLDLLVWYHLSGHKIWFYVVFLSVSSQSECIHNLIYRIFRCTFFVWCHCICVIILWQRKTGFYLFFHLVSNIRLFVTMARLSEIYFDFFFVSTKAFNIHKLKEGRRQSLYLWKYRKKIERERLEQKVNLRETVRCPQQ